MPPPNDYIYLSASSPVPLYVGQGLIVLALSARWVRTRRLIPRTPLDIPMVLFLISAVVGWWFAYDREARRFYNLGPLYDERLDVRCVIPHDLTMTDDDVIFTGETDMPNRSTAALWEVKVEW